MCSNVRRTTTVHQGGIMRTNILIWFVLFGVICLYITPALRWVFGYGVSVFMYFHGFLTRPLYEAHPMHDPQKPQVALLEDPIAQSKHINALWNLSVEDGELVRYPLGRNDVSAKRTCPECKKLCRGHWCVRCEVRTYA